MEKDTDNLALVLRLSGALEKEQPGAKRILSGMVADTLALLRKPPQPPRAVLPLRIVHVDDEPAVLELFEYLIRGWLPDAKVLSFGDGVSALEELSRTSPDLLITDIRMARMSGMELCERLMYAEVTYPIIVHSPEDPAPQWVSELAARGLNISFLEMSCFFESFIKNFRNALEAAGLQFPLDSATPGETKPIKNQTQTPKRSGRLLIVDDVESVREHMRACFKDDYDLFMAEDGPTAIGLAEQNDIDVVVTNIRMAGMSGIDLLERLKYMKPDIEVIIATTLESADARRQALQLGACDYINKPIDIATMRAAISKAMQRRTRGSEITAARSRSTSNAAEVAGLTPQTRPLRIVMLDDEENFLDLYGMFTKSFLSNATVLAFSDAEEAFQELMREAPDLFTTDQNHKKINGLELLRILTEKQVEYPVLLITGGADMAMQKQINEYRDHGFNFSLLCKPVAWEDFRTAVETALQITPNRAP